jgi:hypothetical protein
MAAITQQIPTFLGGVSTQQDNKKSPGQVSEIVNGYPDPTFGLVKRNGSQFLTTLTTSGLVEDGYWFNINRDDDESYIGVVTAAGDIRIWNMIPTLVGGQYVWTEATVSGKSSADVISYLTSPVSTKAIDNIHNVTYLDHTYLINKTKTVTMQARTAYTLGTRGTVVVSFIEKGDYKVYLNGSTFSVAIAAGDTLDHVLTTLKTAIDAAAAGYTVTKYGSSLEITKATAFTLEVKGGDSGLALTSYQDEVTSANRLSATTVNGRRVKIINPIDERNSYFVKFVGVAGATTGAGTGYWEEDLGWDLVNGTNYLASAGFNAETMPYKLVNTGLNTFSIAKETWAPRATGNDYGNPLPSFVGRTIKYGVLNSNRLAFLSSDSVVMSVAKDFSNFFYTSAQTITAADPVDVDVSSFRVGSLHSAVSRPQGLVMFSQFEQFLLYSESGNLTPFDSIVRTIGQYESAADVEAKDMGSYVAFVSRTPLYSKVFGMQPRGGSETPSTVDISQVVAEYIPTDLKKLTTDPQNSLLAAYSETTKAIYLYKFYSNGEQQLMQAWFKWTLPGSIQYMEIIQNVLFFITKTNAGYQLGIVSTVQTPSPVTSRFPTFGNITLTTARLDFLYPIISAGTITYNSTTQRSTIPKPYTHITGKKPVAVTVPTITVSAPKSINDLTKIFVSSATNDPNAGFVMDVTIDPSTGVWTIPGNWVGQEAKLIVGYEFEYNVELPTYYYRGQNTVDWNATLTIARMKFSIGLTGAINFYLKKYGSIEWRSLQSVQEADRYIETNAPLIQNTVLTVPIHQRNTSFQLKINSTSPFPVSLNGMSWEGNYSSRYYRRA